MMQRVMLILVLLVSQSLFSQELFFNLGSNSTVYNYKNSLGQSNPNLRSSTGSFYEFGYEFLFGGASSSMESNFSYAASLTLNQFNAKGGDFNNTYSWNTSYLGIQNAVLGTVVRSSKNTFVVKLKAGLNTSTIVKGEQTLNNVVYDIKNHSEFKGLLVQPMGGVDLRLELTEAILLSAGYNYSKAFNVSNKSSEKLGFSTHQIQLGLHYNIN